MGSCCDSERQPEDPRLVSDFGKEIWYKDQIYFDAVTFAGVIRKSDYERTQKRLKVAWIGFTPLTTTGQCNVLDVGVLERLRPSLWRGVPYARMREVLQHLFHLDEQQAESQYESAIARVRDASSLPLNPSRVSAFLTEAGIPVVRAVERALVAQDSALAQCIILPRVVQMLLWFGNEYAAMAVINALRNEKGEEYFPVSTAIYDQLYAQVLKSVLHFHTTAIAQYFSEQQLSLLVKDMLDNLMLGYVRAEFLGCVLTLFIAGGIKGVAQTVVKMIVSTAAAALSKVDWTSEENVKKEFQSVCMHGIDLLKVMESAQSLDLEAAETADTEPPTKVQFLPQSVILNDPDITNYILSFLPNNTQSLHRVYQASARVLGELYTTWKVCKDPQLLLVRIDHENVLSRQAFALFLDRTFAHFDGQEVAESESALVQLSPKQQGGRHVRPFNIKLSELSDMEFYDANR